jgi:Asp/Glu/hydantoin racemase
MTPRAPADVKLYVTKTPDQPYDEIYMIRSDANNSEQALEAMREKGAALGCDAIVIAGAADRIVSTPDSEGNATLSMREGFVGACVLFQ